LRRNNVHWRSDRLAASSEDGARHALAKAAKVKAPALGDAREHVAVARARTKRRAPRLRSSTGTASWLGVHAQAKRPFAQRKQTQAQRPSAPSGRGAASTSSVVQ
jgi:hypothetical protein